MRLKPLLLPAEHGGWAFLLEPAIIAGLALPSPATALLIVAALAAFLARQPLRIALVDVGRGRRVPRTRVAAVLGTGLAVVALLAIAGAVLLSGSRLLAAAPIVGAAAAVQLWFDVRGAGRRLLPEVAGAAALSGLAGAAALAAPIAAGVAALLWASVLLRTLPALLTVRERVRRLHGHAPARAAVAGVHAAALVASGTAVLAGAMPAPVWLVAALLAARAAWHLRDAAPPVPAMRLGVRELAAGAAAATTIGASWRAWL